MQNIPWKKLGTKLQKGTTATLIRAQAIREWVLPLIKKGMSKVKADTTAPAEVSRSDYSID